MCNLIYSKRSSLRSVLEVCRQALVIASITAAIVSVILCGLWVFTSTIEEIYAGYVRDVIQFSCGESTKDEFWYRLRPGTCHFRNLEFDTVVSVDDDGFRNKTPTASPQVAVIGDSMAMGWGVNDSEVFSLLLAQNTGMEVRNLAISSWATARELAALLRYAQDARYVIWQYSDNDFSENQQSVIDPQYFRRQHADLAVRFTEAQNQFYTEYHKPVVTKIARGLRGVLVQHRGLPPRYRANEDSVPMEAKVFRKIVQASAEPLKGKLLILFESDHFGLNRRTFKEVFERELAQIQGLEFVVLDATSFLRRSHYFRLDDHLNASGHRVIATEIEVHLRAFSANHDH